MAAPPAYPLDPVLVDVITLEYEGEKDAEGHQHGQGSSKFVGGHEYVGEYVQNRMHGKGKYTWADGTVYEGDFVHNVVCGEGVYTWPDGSVYTGSVVNGLRHGTGTFQCQESSCPSFYEGSWEDGKRSGEGTIYYNGKRTVHYMGHWANDCRHGTGTMTYKSGNTYAGEWANNVKHGEGRMEWKNLDESYEGQWANDAQHGFGKHVWKSERASKHTPGIHKQMCNSYRGQFAAGLRHGIGKFFYANGAMYDGEWKENTKDGSGVFTYPDGSIYQGGFTNDRMTELVRKEEDKKSNPKEVKMNIQDLFTQCGFTPKQATRQMYELNNTLLLYFSQFKSMYKYYSALGSSSVASMFTMTMKQLWKFVKDSKILCPSTSMAKIDRCVFQMRKQQAIVVEESKERRRRKDAGLPDMDSAIPLSILNDTTIDNDSDVHDSQRPLLFRDFMEIVVRVAFARYANEIDDSTGDVLSMSQRLQTLATRNILEQKMNNKGEFQLVWARPQEGSGSFSIDPKAQKALDEHHDSLRGVFKLYAKAGQNPRDTTLTLREFILLLKECGVINETFTVSKAKQVFMSSTFHANIDADDLMNFDTEMIYEEFVAALVAVAQAANAHKLALDKKVDRFITDSILPNLRTVNLDDVTKRYVVAERSARDAVKQTLADEAAAAEAERIAVVEAEAAAAAAAELEGGAA